MITASSCWHLNKRTREKKDEKDSVFYVYVYDDNNVIGTRLSILQLIVGR